MGCGISCQRPQHSAKALSPIDLDKTETLVHTFGIRSRFSHLVFGVRRSVKICGLSTADTLIAALDAKADMVGVVFFPRSPRHITLERAAALAEQARGRAAIVALTVDADDATLDAIVDAVAPDWLQLHGIEPPERVAAVRARTGRRVMKAVGVSTAAEVAAAVARYAGVADRLLFDAKPPNDAAHPGGNGTAFDWSIFGGLDLAVPFMLSGGLTAANVAAALRATGAGGADVSSGVEVAPGVKDAGLIAAFVAAARQPR